MRTKILKNNQVDEAVALLKDGELVALPTETVYGLAADACNEHAIQKVFSVKGRPTNHPLILHIDSYDNLDFYAKNISIYARKLAEFFWPGPLTMVLNKKENVNDLVTGGMSTVAIRVPNNTVMLDVLKKMKNGIVAPSANPHQKISSTTTKHIIKNLYGKIAAVIDDGISAIGIESTIIDMTKEEPTILRPGVITQEMIEQVLMCKIKNPRTHTEKISGNMKHHYQPEKPLFLLTLSQIASLSAAEKNSVIMHHSDLPIKNDFFYYKMPKEQEQYAKHLYLALHELDGHPGVEKIFVEMPPDSPGWDGVMDRLTRAAVK